MNNNRIAVFFALSAIVSWSTAATAFKIALRNLSYFQLLFMASFVAVVLLFIFLILEKKMKQAWRIERKQIGISMLSALLNPIAYYLILLKAYTLLPAQIAQPLNYTWPLVLVVISSFFLKQKLKFISLIALLISFLGVIVISTQGHLLNLKIEEPLGVFLASTSSVVWAFFWILNVKDRRNELVKLFHSFFIATVFLLIIALLFVPGAFEIHFNESFVAAIYVGFFELAIPFYLWLKALQMVQDNSKINNLVYISPFLSLIFIHLILKEDIYLTTLIGLVFIIAGIFIQQLLPIKKQKNVSK